MYNEQLVYKVVIRVVFGISVWKEKVVLSAYQNVEKNHWLG